MLAAGHGEDATDTAVHGIGKGIVRGGIAGVERYQHIHSRVVPGVPAHIPPDKAQPVVAVL